jgi:hypothetical protein
LVGIDSELVTGAFETKLPALDRKSGQREAPLEKEVRTDEEQFDFQSVYYCDESAGVRYTPMTTLAYISSRFL